MMSQVKRNNPTRGSASESRFSIFEFLREFPDDATCLDYLMGKLYPDGVYCPKCEKVTKHHRENGRPSYACQFCGHHEHPLVGTIFENSATALNLWFYAIYLMASTRCGISAKQLERELGVTYKTAWRMAKMIRSLLDQDDEPFDGIAEFDEAYIGGQAKWRSQGRSRRAGVTGHGAHDKTPVIGMAQRGRNGESGKVSARVFKTKVSGGEFRREVHTKLLPGTTIYTDDAWAYTDMTKAGFPHKRVPHAQKVYVSGDVHVNTIEGFWALLKGGLGGVYHSVSTKHLQSYLDEYTFRYNNRDVKGRGMFEAFIGRIAKDRTPTRQKGASAWKVRPS